MVIALICMIPLAFMAGVFSALKSVQIGLRWQMQTAKKQEPTMETPVEKVTQAADSRKQEEMMKYSQEQLKEYFFGAGGDE